MTDELLQEIEARAAAATPGPWRDDIDDTMLLGADGKTVVNDDFRLCMAQNGDANTALILHAQADITALVKEVRRLQKSLADAHDVARIMSENAWPTGRLSR